MKPLPTRLPRALEAAQEATGLVAALSRRSTALGQNAGAEVASLPLFPSLVDVLRGSHTARRLVRGLENVDKELSAEKRGLALADASAGARRGQRVSRLLLVAGGCGERFYRQVDRLLVRHHPRVMAFLLEADAAKLGSAVFGGDSAAQVVMLAHKDAVVAALRAVAVEIAAE